MCCFILLKSKVLINAKQEQCLPSKGTSDIYLRTCLFHHAYLFWACVGGRVEELADDGALLPALACSGRRITPVSFALCVLLFLVLLLKEPVPLLAQPRACHIQGCSLQAPLLNRTLNSDYIMNIMNHAHIMTCMWKCHFLSTCAAFNTAAS